MKRYIIKMGEEYANCGFCSLIRHTLSLLAYAKGRGLSPSVIWGDQVLYCDPDTMESGRTFSYYFNETGPDTEEGDTQYSRPDDVFCFTKNRSYDLDERDLHYLGGIYREYISLNPDIYSMVEKDRALFDREGKILGIHLRGTDYKKNFNSHPASLTCEDIFEMIEKQDLLSRYDRVFIASDEQAYVDELTQKYGDISFALPGISRSEDGEPLHYGRGRSVSPYKLGQDILREVYALSRCDGLVGGKSNVTMVAEILKYSAGEEFTDLIVRFDGRNNNDRDYLKHFNSMQTN